MIKILVLLTVHNRVDATKRVHKAFENINRQKIEFDFVVCDDGSTDDTFFFLKSVPNVKVIKGNGDLYWAGGMRRAFGSLNKNDIERYDYLLCINNDILLKPDFDGIILESIENVNEVLVGNFVSCDDGTGTYGGQNYSRSQLRPIFELNQTPNAKVDTFNMNFVLIPTCIVIKHGFLSGNYRHQRADFDYGLRLTHSGCKIRNFSRVLGSCSLNTPRAPSFDPDISMIERFKRVLGVKEQPIKERLRFYKRYAGSMWWVGAFLIYLVALNKFLYLRVRR